MIESIFFGFVMFLGAWSLKSYALSLRPISLLERITISEVSKPRASNLVTYLRGQTNLSQRPSKKNASVLYELPDLINLLAVGIAAGESLHSSLSFVTSRASGLVAQELQVVMKALELGSSLEVELEALADRLPQNQLTELCNKLLISLKRGTSLSHMLTEQAESIRSEIQIQRIKRAGKNETLMMVPLVFLILPVTVLFAIFPSLSLLNIEII
jgi:tight adherence protein C